MTENIQQPLPPSYGQILEDTEKSGFGMASDILTCSLLRVLAASKPSGKFLELGTGTGLSTSWILHGMDSHSSLVSIDNDQKFMDIASKHLAYDKRLTLECKDGGLWFSDNSDRCFDYIFADTWHGKYLLLDEALSMLSKGGLYIIDDMLPQPNWPEGHAEKVTHLITELERRQDLHLVKQAWATGLIIAVKK